MEMLQQANASIAEEEATASEDDSGRNRTPEPELELNSGTTLTSHFEFKFQKITLAFLFFVTPQIDRQKISQQKILPSVAFPSM